MPSVNQPEKEPVLPGVEEVKRRIEKKEPLLERERTPEEKEKAVRKEIKEYLRELQQTPSTTMPVVKRDEAQEISKFPHSQQVSSLISLVFDKGLEEAIAVARALDNPAILDEFHDILVDRYYEELLRKKLL